METTSILLPLAAILILAKMVALASKRVGMPAVFGELLVGLLLGPSVLGLLHETDILKAISSLGVIILMFIAGLETDLDLMKKVGVAAFLSATGGVIAPLVLGTLAGLAAGLPFFVSLFIGTALTATSVSISAETLQELGKLRTRAGTTVLGAAVIDDVMGVVVLALVLGTSSGSSLWLPVGKMVLFFVVATVVGVKVLPWLNAHLLKLHNHAEEALIAVVLAFVLFYSWAAEEMGGVAAITGAYLMGVLLSRLEVKERLEKGMRAIGYGFFIPVFFVSIGLQANFSILMDAPRLAIVISLLAIFSKVVGCFLGAWLGRLKRSESFLVGVGMISRGEVALVIASLGISVGYIDNKIFSIIIFVTILTTVITPLLLKLSYTVIEGRSAAQKAPQLAPGSARSYELGAAD
ncbi:MAG TPA: cation:proton antiporter [Chloroflexia bacterium]|nr:cation:proton antiporter [Chloroflexia bacterium]